MNSWCPASHSLGAQDDESSSKVVEFNLTIGLNQYLAKDSDCDPWATAHSLCETRAFRQAIRQFFEILAADERASVLSLADNLARMTHSAEPESATPPAPEQLREMLGRALWEKARLIAEYPSRISNAGACANRRLQSVLERQLADEIRHQGEFVCELAGLNDSGFRNAARECSLGGNKRS